MIRSIPPTVHFAGGLSDFRRSILLQHVQLPCDVLEIGPYARPTLLPKEARLKVLDYFSTEDLKKSAAKDGFAPDDVIPVDFVCKDDNYAAVVHDKYDLIIANHVFEHILNPIAWLNMMRNLLREGGILFLVLPDKKYGTDKFRQDTQLSHILYDYLQPDRNLREIHALEKALYYDMSYVKQENLPEQRLNLHRLRQDLDRYHPGFHAHVFQFETFPQQILKPIIYMDAIQYSMLEVVNYQAFGEFAVVLRAEQQPSAISVTDFFKPSLDSWRD